MRKCTTACVTTETRRKTTVDSEVMEVVRRRKGGPCSLLEGLDAGVAVTGDSIGCPPKTKRRNAISHNPIMA